MSLKKEILKSSLKKSIAKVSGSPSVTEISLVRNPPNAASLGMEGEFVNSPLFVQLFKSLHHAPVETLRVGSGSPLFVPKFTDDNRMNDLDAMEGYTTTLKLIADELRGEASPLFVSYPDTSSTAADQGPSRGVSPYPSAVSPQHLEMFAFVGKLLGVSIRTNIRFPLPLSPVVWSRLLYERVSREDLYNHMVDYGRAMMALRSLVDPQCQSDAAVSLRQDPAIFQELVHQNFTATNAAGKAVELIPNGREKKVEVGNLMEFCDAMDEYKLKAMDVQIDAIRRGLSLVVPLKPLLVLSGEQLYSIVRGSNVSYEEALEQLKWMYRVVLLAGARVRSGLELSAGEVTTLDPGTIIEGTEFRINQENIPRIRVEGGWISEMLNPASGSTGPVVEVTSYSFVDSL